jgi:hypothetical protein
VTRLRAGQWRIRGSESVGIGCWAYPAFHSLGSVGRGAFPGIEEPGREADHLVPRLSMSRTALIPSWRAQG